MNVAEWRLCGSVLSPFFLKTRALLERARVPFRMLPRDGTRLENLRVIATWQAMRRGYLRPSFPALNALSELPLVPFVFGPRGERLFDSTAIGLYFDARGDVPLVPLESRAAFACRLIDEALDEVGLYALHHQRWVISAQTTRAPEIAADEYRSVVPALLRGRAMERFAARQVRRLAYLFSVAPEGFAIPGVRSARVPAHRAGFPPTHALCETLHRGFVDALEHALADGRDALFGSGATLADAAARGVFGSHQACDPTTAAQLARRAPALDRWVRSPVSDGPAAHRLDARIEPLLRFSAEALLPLLCANEAAWLRDGARPASECNERAYDRGDALFSGELLGHPYRTVIKTFQVNVLRELRACFAALAPRDQRAFVDTAPALALLRVDTAPALALLSVD